MSGGAAAASSSPTRAGASPTRARHHVSRSITDRLPGPSSKHHGHSHQTHSHHHITGHISASLHRRARSRDERHGSTAAQSAAALLHYITPRSSLEVPRTEGAASVAPSPQQSRRGSILIPANAESAGLAGIPLSTEALRHRERVKAAARTAGLRNSLVTLTTFSSTTNRRLDEAYYTVLQKLTALQNTILALKELAGASAATSDGFSADAQSVLTEAQSQLDALGDFSEQQDRVQALQDRVHGGRERIAALSERVDVVRRRVEKWERADREWQERTRRKLKIVWGVVLGLGLLFLVLYLGARFYAPEIDGTIDGLTDSAVASKMELGQKRADASPSQVQRRDRENDSVPVVDFHHHRDREVDVAMDDALRALDEL
ncbi:hypothetical protein BD289DRAFT_425625 [Coniella lustricola]|uniref:Uncharacterized protein n=1 Tax=Coniella lustricola TaxID=2025994 RepID=A0A2T3AH39_9PEZI|nr:hypothetical protein BD289DRAFT_425625 [Coniella lustricola]